MLGWLSIWQRHFLSAVLHILLAAGRQQLAQHQQGPFIDAVTLCIVLRHNCQPPSHCLNAVKDMLYKVERALVNFNINNCVVGRALSGVAWWDMMGINGWQGVATEQHKYCQNGARGWLAEGHKHHKSKESIVSGGDQKRELVPPGRQQWAVRVLHHDEWSLTSGRLLLGVLSHGDIQDSSIGRFHHGGALVIWSLRKPQMSLGFIQLFEFPCRINIIILSGLWQPRRTYLCRSYIRLSSQRVLRLGAFVLYNV